MGLNYNPASVTQGLVYYLDLTNSRCYSGSGNTLTNLANGAIGITIVSGITYDTDYRKNLNFNGSSGYMTGNDTNLDFSTSDFTIQTTLKLNGLSNGFTGAFDQSICAGSALTNNSSIFFVSGTATSHNGLGLWHQPATTTIKRNFNFQTNKIYNLAVTKRFNLVEFFVDGTSIGTTTSSNNFNFTANGFAIGRWYYPGYEQYLKGSIFDFRAYNRALSIDEIQQNYFSQTKRYYNEENIVTNGLVLNIDPSKSTSYSGVGNTIYDLSGFGNTGALTNGPTFSGLNGGSLTFNGTSQYIDLVPSGTGITLTSSSNYNISCWVYVDSSQPKIAPSIIEKYNGVGGYPIAIRYGSNSIYTIVYDGSNSAATGGSVAFNTWTYFSANNILSQKKLEVYMNSSLMNSTTYSTLNNITTTASIKVGYRGFDANTYFAGKVAFLTIYNRALTQQEISQNFNALRSRFGI